MAFSTAATIVPTARIWVESGSGTPIASFDGASVGITYSQQLFAWERLGKRVFFEGRITFSSKGSSTGALRLAAGSFPYASIDANMSGYPISLEVVNMTSGIGDSALTADVIAGTGSPYIRLWKYASGTRSGLLDTDCTNTSSFIFNGAYRVA